MGLRRASPPPDDDHQGNREQQCAADDAEGKTAGRGTDAEAGPEGAKDSRGLVKVLFHEDGSATSTGPQKKWNASVRIRRPNRVRSPRIIRLLRRAPRERVVGVARAPRVRRGIDGALREVRLVVAVRHLDRFVPVRPCDDSYPSVGKEAR